MHTPTNNNNSNTNVMQNNTIKLIAHNYCMGETNWFNTNYSQSEELTPELFHLYKERVNTPNKFMPADCEIDEFRLYTIPLQFPFTLENFLNEAFSNLLRGLLTASGDDSCFDYIPCSIDQFSSILQVLLQSKIQDIPQTDLDLYGKLYDAYMQSFDHSDESAPHYIGTDLLTWEQVLNTKPEFPAIIL